MKAINWPFLAFFIETSSQLMCILRVLGRICCIFSIIKIKIIVFYNEKKMICWFFHLVFSENNQKLHKMKFSCYDFTANKKWCLKFFHRCKNKQNISLESFLRFAKKNISSTAFVTWNIYNFSHVWPKCPFRPRFALSLQHFWCYAKRTDDAGSRWT